MLQFFFLRNWIFFFEIEFFSLKLNFFNIYLRVIIGQKSIDKSFKNDILFFPNKYRYLAIAQILRFIQRSNKYKNQIFPTLKFGGHLRRINHSKLSDQIRKNIKWKFLWSRQVFLRFRRWDGLNIAPAQTHA